MKKALLHILLIALLMLAPQGVQALCAPCGNTIKKQAGTIESTSKIQLDNFADTLRSLSFDLPHTPCVQHGRQQQTQWQGNGSHTGKFHCMHFTKLHNAICKQPGKTIQSVAEYKKGKDYYVYALRQIII